VIYRIDSNDDLVYADGAFQRFADAAGVPSLPAQWAGKSLWGCFADDELRAVFVALVARARTGRTVAFNTRCDSPSLSRTVAMEIAPWADGGVEFRCTPANAALHAPERTSCCDLLRVCAWCYRAHCDGAWRDIEEVVAGEQVLEHARLPIVTHGICDACLADTDAELDALATA
jgi:hypothetical protein